MPIISIVNQKGGTGKTTTTMNLGAALSQMGKRVMIIDMDPQGNLGYSLGLDEGKTISDVLEGDTPLSDCVQKREGMDVVPSDIRLVDIELSLVDLDERHKTLSNHIMVLNGNYDYLLVDCPPSLSILAINGLYASDYIIVPMLMEVLSLQGLDQIIKTVEKIKNGFEKDLGVLGILPVMVDKRRKLSEEVKEYIKENYDLRIFNAMIRNNVKASESPSFGQSVISYAPASNSAKDYVAFAKEVVELI